MQNVLRVRMVSFFLLTFACCVVNAQRLVLPGDFPDPSVVKIGDTYWASATTSNWAPVYPLLQSKDLVRWTQAGHVFEEKPDWADYYFWAPEISYENGKVYIYYSAHKKDGNLCVAIASADKPEGPYKDHGPLICEEAGSIDAFVMRDENGKLFMIWKEDGNSIGQPTPIWAAEMNEERTKLISERKELFRNDAPWERNLVEGISIIRNGEYFYAFYAAAGCCGPGCTYANGIARSKSLHGPWEKFSGNPILKDSDKWKCPGHGTPVEYNGKHYFMYHAYHPETTVFAGRQGLVQEFRFTEDGWIEFVADNEEVKHAAVPAFRDDFSTSKLGQSWQYSIFKTPRPDVNAGTLILHADADPAANFIGQKTYTATYTALTEMDLQASTARGGLALIGDEKNLLAILADRNSFSVVLRSDGKEETVASGKIPGGNKLFLRMKVQNASQVRFQYSTDNREFVDINREPFSAEKLPPWDRALRAGLIVAGSKGSANFTFFELNSE